MANNANFRVPVRRRRQGKTDYQARKAMVISGKNRLVVRPSINNVNAQIIIAKPIGDMVLAAANSRELVKKYGWKASTGNIPAAYLTGLLCGLKAKVKGINEAILDIGMAIPTKGSRIFAVLHGVLDAGVEVPHGEEKIVPGRAKGDHIASYAKDLSNENPELFAVKFSKYTAEGIAPQKVAEHFSKTRAAIIVSFKDAKVAPELESIPEAKSKTEQTTKQEAKAASAPKVTAKVEKTKITKTETKKPEVKLAKELVPTAKEQAPKAKAVLKAEKSEKAATEKASSNESKVKISSKEKVTAKTKKETEVLAQGKASAKKATKKGEKKE